MRAFLILLVLGLSTHSWAMDSGSNDTSVSLLLGEAFGPSGIRVKIRQNEYGIHRYSGISWGQKAYFNEMFYGSFGFGTGGFSLIPTNLAVYGIVGVEAYIAFAPWLNIYYEVQGTGRLFDATVRSIGQVGLGVAW